MTVGLLSFVNLPTGQKGQINFSPFDGIDFPLVNMRPFFARAAARSATNPQDALAFINSDGYPTGFPTGSSQWTANGTLYYPGIYATFTGSVTGTALTVSGSVTGTALAIGQTVRGTGITDGTRIVSGSGTSWVVSNSMSATGSITITATIPWVVTWSGNTEVDLGIQPWGGSVQVVHLGSNRTEYHIIPRPQAVVIGDLTGSSVSTLNITSFVSGSFVGNGAPITGIGLPPQTFIQYNGGGTGSTGNYAVSILPSGGTLNISYNVSGGTFTIPGTSQTEGLSTTIDFFNIVTTPSNIQVFRQDEESLLGVQTCSPHFINYYKKYGRMRFLNWMQTNGNMQAQWIQRTAQSYFSWTSNQLITAVYGGVATNSTKNDFSSSSAISYTDTSGVTQTSGSTWLDGMMLQTAITAAPTVKNISGFTNANPASVTCTSHGFTTGDVVFFPTGDIVSTGGSVSIDSALNSGVSNGLLAKCIYTITVVDANHFTLNSTDSTTWGTYSSGGTVGYQIRFKTGSLPYKLAVAQPLINFLSGSLSALAIDQTILTFIYNADLDVLMLASHLDAGRGIPIETACQMANECGVDPWVSVPMYATDNFVTQMATTIKANLNTNRKWCMEVSNEVWNPGEGFEQTAFTRYVALAKFPGAAWGSDFLRASYEFYGYRFYNIVNLINGVFTGGDYSRCTRIFAFKTDDAIAAPTYNVWRYTAPDISALSGIAPISVADELCQSNYTGDQHSDFTTDAAAAAAIGNYQQGILTGNSSLVTSALNAVDSAVQNDVTFLTPYWTYYGNLATSLSMKMSAYEGGFGPTVAFFRGGAFSPISPMSYLGIAFNNQDQLNLWAAYQLSSQYGATYTTFLNLWKSLNGIYPSQYQSIGFEAGTESMFAFQYPNIFGPSNPGQDSFNAFNAS